MVSRLHGRMMEKRFPEKRIISRRFVSCAVAGAGRKAVIGIWHQRVICTDPRQMAETLFLFLRRLLRPAFQSFYMIGAGHYHNLLRGDAIPKRFSDLLSHPCFSEQDFLPVAVFSLRQLTQALPKQIRALMISLCRACLLHGTLPEGFMSVFSRPSVKGAVYQKTLLFSLRRFLHRRQRQKHFRR